jgi:predicted transcriptional regulator
MQAFWRRGEATVAEVREQLTASGGDLAYTTVATLVRILYEKGFLKQTHSERPFRYAPTRSFEEVSGKLLRELVNRVFRGSREQLLLRLFDQSHLSPKERELLEQVLREKKP